MSEPLDLSRAKARLQLDPDCDCAMCIDTKAMIEEIERYRAPSPVGTAPLRDAQILEAIDAEPELPGPMPMEMFQSLQHPDTAAEAFRIMVRETKKGIRNRILALLPRSAPTLKGAPADEQMD